MPDGIMRPVLLDLGGFALSNARTVVTLLPSATEIVAGMISDPARLLGVTHECDYPAWVQEKKVLIRPFAPLAAHSQAEIDELVKQRAASGESTYEVDAQLLDELSPDVVVTQGLCDVCAASESEVGRAIATLSRTPKVVSLKATTIEGILEDLVTVGQAVGEASAAKDWVEQLGGRIEAVRTRAASVKTRPRAAMLEWFDPFYVGGHWVPEMIEAAGGTDPLGRAGKHSFEIGMDAFRAAEPEIILLAGCGYDVEENLHHAESLPTLEGWADLPAVRAGRVYAVDANSLTCRPGPRIVDGMELFYELFHGDPAQVDGLKARPFSG